MDQYLRDLLKVVGIGGAFALLPALAALAGLAPPWPPAIGGVSALLVLVFSLIVWEWVRKSRTSSRRIWIVAALFLTLTGLIAYLLLYSLFIEPVPGTDERVVRGFTCTADALTVYPKACPDLPREALADAEWEAHALWTRQSVTLVRMGLALSWLVFTAGLIATVGAILAGRRLKAPASNPAD
jgi:uncharacterized membrane protein YfcA